MLMRQLLQHVCLTYGLGAVLQADMAAARPGPCDEFNVLIKLHYYGELFSISGRGEKRFSFPKRPDWLWVSTTGKTAGA